MVSTSMLSKAKAYNGESVSSCCSTIVSVAGCDWGSTASAMVYVAFSSHDTITLMTSTNSTI